MSIVRIALLLPVGLQFFQDLEHLQRGPDRMFRMAWILLGGAPDRHHRIPDVLVHRALVLHDNIAHGGEVFVHEAAQLFGLHLFRKCGEPADIAEKNGEDLLFAEQGQFFGMPDQFVDNGRRHVVAEGGVDETFFPAFEKVIGDGHHQKEKQQYSRGIDEADDAMIQKKEEVIAQFDGGEKSRPSREPSKGEPKQSTLVNSRPPPTMMR